MTQPQPRPDLQKGDRIRLTSMPDDPNPVEAGMEGTVTGVQNCGAWWQVHVRWDGDRSLSLAIPPDTYEKLEPAVTWRATQNGFDLRTLGYIPRLFHAADPAPAAEQLGANYPGGLDQWADALLFDHASEGLAHVTFTRAPERTFNEVARAELRDETLIVFETGFLAIVQPDGSSIVCNVN